MFSEEAADEKDEGEGEEEGEAGAGVKKGKKKKKTAADKKEEEEKKRKKEEEEKKKKKPGKAWLLTKYFLHFEICFCGGRPILRISSVNFFKLFASFFKNIREKRLHVFEIFVGFFRDFFKDKKFRRSLC